MRLLDSIQASYKSFNKARRRIADAVLSNPARCSFLSIREFAALAGTTDVTVINFCKALGFSSYSEFRKELQSYVLECSEPNGRLRLLASSSDSAADFHASIAEREMRGVEESFKNNSADKLLAVNSFIRQAETIFVAGHNASFYSASYLRYRYSLLGVRMNLLDLAEVHQMVSLITPVDPSEALLFAISTPPYGKPTIALTELCRERGFKIVCMTDQDNSPLVPYSDISLISPALVQFGALTSSYTSFIALIEALTFFYCFGEDLPEDGKSSMENEFAELLKRLGG